MNLHQAKSKSKSDRARHSRDLAFKDGSSNVKDLPYSSSARMGSFYSAGPVFGLGAHVQAKVAIGRPNDQYEREADAVADNVTAGLPVPSISRISSSGLGSAAQRQEEKEELVKEEKPVQELSLQRQEEEREKGTQEKFIQRQEEDEGENEEEEPERELLLKKRAELEESSVQSKNGARISSYPHASMKAVASRAIQGKGPGKPMNSSTRGTLESRMGVDLSEVKVHKDSNAHEAAEALRARAFTRGKDIWLGRGENTVDMRLMAHEVTHVLQQDGIVRRKPMSEDEEKIAAHTVFSSEETSHYEERRIPGTPQETKPEAVPPVRFPEIGVETAPTTTVPASKPAPATPLEAKAEMIPTAVAPVPPEVKIEDSAPMVAPEAEVTPKVKPKIVPKAVAIPVTPAEPSATVPPAPGRAEVGAPPPEPQIDASSPEGLLQSLATVPPSTAGQAMEKACAAVPGIQTQEKAQLEASFPAVERSTGLPRKSERKLIKPTVLEKKKDLELTEETGRKGKPPEVIHQEARGAVPGSKVSTEVTEPREEEGGKWWSRLINRLRGFIGALPTRDPGLSTSAGPRPRMDLSGEANPQQNLQKKQTSDKEVNISRTKADAAVTQDFGENDAYPDAPVETLRPTYKPKVPMISPEGPGKKMPTLAKQDSVVFDQTASSWYSSKVNEEHEKYQLEQGVYRKKSQEARAEGQRCIAEETARTNAEQEEMQEQARSEVNEERRRWREQNRKIQEKYATESEAKRKDIDQKISDKVKNAEKESDEKMAEAEAKAEAKRRKAETEAAEEKRKAKKKPRSWWQRAKGAISSAFKAIKKAVNAIFDALRKAVKVIIEAAKAAVRGIIELARKAIVGLIKLFGEVLKGLVTIALAAFPEAAAKARGWIDKRVNQAVKAVNKAAEVLKKVTDAILDFVGEVLDTALSVLQKIYNVALNVLKFLTVGLMEIMERIGHLVSAARQMPDHFWGQMSEELLGMNLSEPLPIERTAPPKPQDAAEAGREAGVLSAEDIDLLNRRELSDMDVTVDQIVPLENLEFFTVLNIQEGEEIEFGELNDPSRSIKAIKEEAVGVSPVAAEASVAGEGTETVAAEPEAPKTAEEELQALMAQEPKGGCTKEKPGDPAKGGDVPEHMKVGPFTAGQRARYLLHQMKIGIKQWFECNWPWLLAGAVAALLGFIALNILTGGAILAALPLIMQIVGAIMIGVAIARVTAYVGEYLSQGWAGKIVSAAKSLARALAIGAIEIIFALLFNLGAVIKSLKAGLKASVKAVAKTAKATVTTTIKSAKELGRLGLKAGKAVIRNGKLVLIGLKSGFAKGVKSLDDLAKRLLQRTRFRKFKITFRNGWFKLLGYINPWVVLMEGPLKGKIEEVSDEAVKGLKKRAKVLFEAGGQKVRGRVLSLTRKFPKRYRSNFDIFAGKTHKDFVIHHLVEQQSKKLIEGKLIDDIFLHSPANLRAIPKGAINEVLHLSKIRVMWNGLYKGIENLSDEAIFIALKHYASYTDDFLSNMLSYADEMGEALTKNGLKQAADIWIKANPIEKALNEALKAAKQVG